MYMFISIFFVLFILEIIYINYAHFKGIKDKPNHRSAHLIPTIRGGGIILIPAVFLFFFFFYNQIEHSLLYFIISILIVSAISFIDDLKTLSPKIRLVFHLIALTIAFLYLEIFSNFSIVVIFVSIATYVLSLGFLNIYNFMDGINGITFLNGLCSYITLLFIDIYIYNFTNHNLITVLMLATLVFGYFNFRKKPKCFAGDVGSITIGFTIVIFTLKLFLIINNFWILLILGVYLLDGGWTIIERLFRRENIFEAHRRHLYQLLANELQIPHLVISSMYFLAQLILNIIVIYSLKTQNNDFFVLILITIILSFIYFVIKRSVYKKINRN